MLRPIHLPLPLVLLAVVGCGPTAREPEPSRAGLVERPVGVDKSPAAVADAHSVSSVGIEFLDDYKSAAAKARAEGKPLLLFFGAQWCAHTQRMAGELPGDPEVARLASDFICVRLDVDAVPKLCEEYRVRAYPTLILTAPGGVVLQRLTGLQSAAQVAQEMSAALTAVADRFPAVPTTLQR
jgi:thiol-disulfide isomerase/thioredoxin